MNIRNNIIVIPSYDPLRYLQLEELKCDELDVTIYTGAQGDIEIETKNINMFLDYEQPNMWYYHDSYENCIKNESRYDYILSLCPYSSEYRNRVLGKKKYIVVPHFLNKKFIPETTEKKVDIIYTGNVFGFVQPFLDVINRFNSRIISNNPSITYSDKLNAISESKICFVHNMLTLGNQANPSLAKHALGDTFISNILPQLKTRCFEAAFGKSLMLCLRDEYNVIEQYFEPEKEFIYCTLENIEYKIQEILQNYGDYKNIIENAFIKAHEKYTTDKLITLLKNNI
jgi:hypothetical protein